jgi:hypothetical protein
MGIVECGEQGFEAGGIWSFHEKPGCLDAGFGERGVEEGDGEEGWAQFCGGVGGDVEDFRARIRVLCGGAGADAVGEEGRGSCRLLPLLA